MSAERPTPIVALDVPDMAAATTLIDRLGPGCRFYKVGLELFAAAGPPAVQRIREGGPDVFLDLKLHDIPRTVQRAASRAAAAGVRLLTVHGIGGAAMVRAAVEGAGESTGILVVTVLTSLDDGALTAAHGRSTAVTSEVLRLAELAAREGAHGVVCGGREAALVRDRFPVLATLVPGVRFAGGDAGDQARVVTPAEAASARATYVVLGRAVTGAADPAAALQRALRELGHDC